MEFGNSFRPIDLDRSINRLLSAAGSDTRDLAFIEPLTVFLSDLSGQVESTVFEHYCTLYGPIIMRATQNETVQQLGYEVLSRMPVLIERIRETAPEPMENDIAAGLKDIHERLALFELNLGNEEKAISHLEKAESFEPGGLTLSEKLHLLGGELSRLQNGSSPDEIKFVAAYSYPDLELMPGLGRIMQAKCAIDVTGEWSMLRNFNQMIAFDTRTLRENDPFDEQISTAVAFAEHHFRKKLKIGEINRLPRAYNFSLTEGNGPSGRRKRITGGSAGLAFALLALSSIDTLGARREKRLIRASAAFTGTIKRDGSVLAVDDKSLRAKVRSVFFSTCRHFVLPKENAIAAMSHLEELKAIYPKRALELVPVENVIDAYDDERIMERGRSSSVYVIFSKAKRRKKHIAVMLSGIVTLVTLLLLVPPRIEKAAFSSYYEHGTVNFVNRYDYNFASYDLGYRVIEPDPAAKLNPRSDKSHELFFQDINGDGTRETVFASVESDSAETNNCGKVHIHFFSYKGELLYHGDWCDSLVISDGVHDISFKKFYYYRGELNDVDGDGSQDLVFCMTDRISSPGIIALASLKDKRVESFVHIGHLRQFIIGDFDKDKRKEIVAAGRSNTHGRAVVVVLDPGMMNGSSPDAFRIKSQGLARDVARYYIKLPQSALCSIEELEPINPEVLRVSADERGMLEFAVNEGGHALIFHFDRDWNCVRVNAIESYASIYNLSQKAYNLPPMDEHLEMLKNSVEYWDGEGWVKTPTMNSSYLKLASESKDEQS